MRWSLLAATMLTTGCAMNAPPQVGQTLPIPSS